MRRNGISAPSRLGGQLLILYDYNRAGNLTDRDNSLHSAFNEDYLYDNLDRLENVQRADDFDQTWTLDATGNFSEFDDDGTSQTREVNEANQIESITGGWVTPEYDAAGNMISGPMAGDGATRLHYKYDAWNRLVEVRDDDGGEPDDLVAQYEYDGANRRIEKVVAGGAHVHYFYDGWQIVDEESVDGQGATVARNEYVWSLRYIDAPIVRFHDGNGDGDLEDPGDNTRYYTTDANHNVTAAFDLGSGAVAERYVYTPYGQVTVYSPTWTTPATPTTDGPLFAGYFYDAETSLYQVRHRYYHAELGAFVSRDPIGYAGGINLYGYCSGDPVSRTDSFGLDDCGCEAPSEAFCSEIQAGVPRVLSGFAEPPCVVFDFMAEAGGLVCDLGSWAFGLPYLDATPGLSSYSRMCQNERMNGKSTLRIFVENEPNVVANCVSFGACGTTQGAVDYYYAGDPEPMQRAAGAQLFCATALAIGEANGGVQSTSLRLPGRYGALRQGSEYIIADATKAARTNAALREFYWEYNPEGSIEYVNLRNCNGRIDPVTGNILLDRSLLGEYQHLHEGALCEELWHFYQFKTQRLLGQKLSPAQVQEIEAGVEQMILHSGFGKLP